MHSCTLHIFESCKDVILIVYYAFLQVRCINPSVYYKKYTVNRTKKNFEMLLFKICAELVDSTARIIEARLKREVAEGKIVDFWRTDRGYEVIRLEALNGRENKVYRNNKSRALRTLCALYLHRVSTVLWPAPCKLSRV